MAVDLALISSVAFNSNIISSDRVLSTVSQVVASQTEAPKVIIRSITTWFFMYVIPHCCLEVRKGKTRAGNSLITATCVLRCEVL